MTGSGQDGPAEDPLREEALDWLNSVLGDPSPETEAAFRAWYDADPRHAETFESVLAAWQRNEASKLTPEAGTHDRLAKYGVRRRFRNCLAIAASLVLGLAVAAGIAKMWIVGSASPVAGHERLTSGTSDIRTVTLPDGSRVTLDAGSELAVGFTATERRLTLVRGRARFDVAHDPDHPFIVTAGSREIVAHGTVFDVDLRGNRLAVSLLRGSIEVRRPAQAVTGADHSRPDMSQFLHPGQRLTVEKPDDVTTPFAAPTDSGDWTSPMLTFSDRPLSEVVASANRYGRDRIVLTGPAVEKLRYSGTIQAGATADIAQMISASFGLEMARDQHGTIHLAQRD